MKKSREILRLHFDCKLSNQQIADAIRKSKGSVFNCIDRFKAAGLQWPLPEEMSDSGLEQRLYSEAARKKDETVTHDFKGIHQEISRPHGTLELLWEEYRQTCPSGLGRSSFYRHYAR